jgi:membrane fusion protein, heavy metal efflux system
MFGVFSSFGSTLPRVQCARVQHQKQVMQRKFTLWKSGGRLAAVVGLAACLGCKLHRSDPDHHDHDHELAIAQITVWGERHEIFIEHSPPVAGEPTTFATHVTDFVTFEPRKEGPIRFRIRQAGEPPLLHLEPAPTRAGLYLVLLTFPGAGEWQVTVLLPDSDGEVAIDLPTVLVFPDAHAAAHAAPPAIPAGIQLLKEQQWSIGVATREVGMRRLVERVALTAQVRAKPGHRATVVVPMPGLLHSSGGRPFPSPGQWIEAGEDLALLRPLFSEGAIKLVEIEAEFVRAKAALVQAEAVYQRVERLAAEQARSPRELEEAALSLAVARANHAAVTALLSTYRPSEVESSNAMPDLELRAPISGFIDSVAAGLGEPVETGVPLFTLLDPRLVWIEARIPESMSGRLTAARSATYELPGAHDRYTDLESVEGRLVFTGLEVDPVTRTVPLVYEVPNPDIALRIGQALTLHVETARVEEALAIPESAIVDEGGRPVAFVQIAGETFEKRNLRLGLRDSGWVQVSGLAPGERVVTRGAFVVRLAAMAPALPAHGHAH